MANDARKLVRTLVPVDRRAAVWCAAQCARTALFVVPAGEVRPSKAIETAEAWVRGEATAKQCERAGRSAYRARDAAGDDAPGYVVEAVATAAIAASSAANAAHIEDLTHAGECAATAVESAYVAHATRERTARKPLHAELFALVSSTRWPATTPTPAQRSAAPPALQVAWDAVAGTALEDLPIPALLAAHARAERLGLDWSDPVARAVAERAEDEAGVARLLTSTTS